MSYTEKNLGRLSGTQWHVGYVLKKENDPRRDKRRCSHYSDGHCNYRFEQCVGSSHCSKYKCRAEENRKKIAKKEAPRLQGQLTDIRIDGIVQRGDSITVYCAQDKQQYTFRIAESKQEVLPPVHKLSLGLKNGERFEYNGFSYKITNIQKMKV